MEGIRRVGLALVPRVSAWVVACTSAVLCGSLATATDVPTQRAVATTINAFETLDRNGDKRLSRSEAGFDRILSVVFADIDANGDGYLTPTEYARATGTAPINW